MSPDPATPQPLPETLEEAHALIRSLRIEVAEADKKLTDAEELIACFQADQDERESVVAWGESILERVRHALQRFHERQRHPGTLDWTRCHHDVCDDLSGALKGLEHVGP